MKPRLLTGLVAAGAILAMAVPALAAGWLPNVTDAPSRFSGPGVYTGQPDLPVTLSMVIAGGGPSDFKTITLVKVLAGDKTDAEVASLTQKFGVRQGHEFRRDLPVRRQRLAEDRQGQGRRAAVGTESGSEER